MNPTEGDRLRVREKLSRHVFVARTTRKATGGSLHGKHNREIREIREIRENMNSLCALCVLSG
jgi:hypothetical protein